MSIKSDFYQPRPAYTLKQLPVQKISLYHLQFDSDNDTTDQLTFNQHKTFLDFLCFYLIRLQIMMNCLKY